MSDTIQTKTLITALISLLVAGGAVWGLSMWLRNSAAERAALFPAPDASVSAFHSNDFPAALATLDARLKSNPRDVDTLLMKATTLAQQGSIQFKEREYGTQAIALAHEALELDARNVNAWRIIGYAHEIMEEYPEAHAAYAKALAIDSTDALTIAQEAHAYDLEGKTTQAEAGYRKAITLNPSLDQATVGLARMLVFRGDGEEAVELFLSVSTSSPNMRVRAESLFSAAEILLQRNENARAGTLLEQAIAIDPNYALAWAGMGRAILQYTLESKSLSTAERTESLKKAITAEAHALSINPDQTYALIQLAKMYSVLHEDELARTTLVHAQSATKTDITLSALQKETYSKQIAIALSKLK